MKKIAVISLNALGDTYLSLSAFPVFREQNRKSEITLITAEQCRELAELSGADRVIYASKNLTSLIKGLMSSRGYFNEVYNFFPGRANSVLFNFLNAERRFGFSNYQQYSEWYHLPQPTASGKHIWHPENNYLKRVSFPLLEAGYAPRELNKYIFPVPIEKRQLPGKTVVLHYSSRSAERRLQNELVNEIVSGLSSGARVLYFDYGSNFYFPERGEAISPNLRTTLELLLSADLFISNDSFPLHLAEAYSVRTIALLGPTRPEAVLWDRDSISVISKPDSQFQAEEVLRIANRILSQK